MSDTFVVNDKRLFSKDGELNTENTSEKENFKDAGEQSIQEDRKQAAKDFAASTHGLPAANLASLFIGLASSAFIHLGENPEAPNEGERVDLDAAKHSIDLLAVLQEKTKGNLQSEEEALLNTLLYDLRLKFVQISTSKK